MKKFWKSFQWKVIVFFACSMLVIACLSNFLIYKFALEQQFSLLQDKLKTIARTSALFIDAEALSRVPLNKEGVSAPEFRAVMRQLNAIRDANPGIVYIYILAKTEKEGIVQFVVDPDIPSADEVAQGISSFPGDHYDATRFPAMLNAFYGPSVDDSIQADEWGAVLSGYAPIRGADGKTVAIIGVDMSAETVNTMQKVIHWRGMLVLILGCLLSLLWGLMLGKAITDPVDALVKATRRIADGDLQQTVPVQGEDEISELAEAFNSMTSNLVLSRKRLNDYFFNIMETFVRILEAKDEYLKGHSQHVAEYAEKIAVKMGLSEEHIRLLRNGALLHDLGKLSVDENILNKIERLTEDEWNILRQHPLVGEEILQPIISQPEILSVVRSHHERYDGRGYPDNLTGRDINIFAAIVSVADSYDAMTSDRAYRASLGREKAIEELKKNRGLQFNAEVVDAFLDILEHETK